MITMHSWMKWRIFSYIWKFLWIGRENSFNKAVYRNICIKSNYILYFLFFNVSLCYIFHTFYHTKEITYLVTWRYLYNKYISYRMHFSNLIRIFFEVIFKYKIFFVACYIEMKLSLFIEITLYNVINKKCFTVFNKIGNNNLL